jgi:hypothetical protein
VDILAVLSLLLIVLAFLAWSSVRSYFARGRLHGMEEATREFIRGVTSHYEIDGVAMPPTVAKAVDAMKALTRGPASYNKRIHRFHARLWVFGDAVGEACWRKGYEAGKRKMAPTGGKIKVELSQSELVHLAWLAHLGFKHMMPNYRSFEMHRFSGKQDAQDSSFAVEKLEVAIPADHRPVGDPLVQSNGRQKLIRNWWPSENVHPFKQTSA